MSEQIDFNMIFNDSYEVVRRGETAFYDVFYEQFLGSSAAVREIFSDTDLNNQKNMLQKAIANMVAFSVTKNAGEYFLDLAKRHNDLNISHDLYDLFMDSLLTALSEFDPKYTKKTAVAWRIMLAPGLEFMKHYGAPKNSQ